MAQAERLRAGGLDVALIFDSLARYAGAAREAGIAAGEAAGRGGYPASAFARTASLVERAGCVGAGSVTLIATVLTESGDPADPLADAVRSFLDGHLVLDRRRAERGAFPALDCVGSLSRAMPAIVSPEHLAAAAKARGALARYEAATEARELGIAPPEPTLEAGRSKPSFGKAWRGADFAGRNGGGFGRSCRYPMNMDINGEIARVQARIAQITGTNDVEVQQPPLTPNDPRGGQFASMVNQAADGEQTQATMPPAEIEQLVQANAATWQVDPALVRAVIANESGFNPKATSKTGAQGLMQLEPDTAQSLGVTDSYDPEQNVWGGTRYLRGLLDRFGGDVTKAVAAYNAGPGAVEKYGGVPPYSETQSYVKNVLSSYQQYSQKKQ